MKHIERFKKMVTMAYRMEWIQKDPFGLYQLKFQKTEREFLSIEELSRIESKHIDNDRLNYVRDMFIFNCYTGLAYSDTIQLNPSNIIIGIDKEYWIKTFRQKTDTPVNVPLLPKAYSILERYRKNPVSVSNGAIFPGISNQKLNSYLKEISDICNIQKHLTFHMARHTFATTVTLTNGVPIETVSKMLGHTKITTTQIYAKVIERKVSDDMLRLRTKLNSVDEKLIDLNALKTVN
jgi:site-specific recombinase XerD